LVFTHPLGPVGLVFYGIPVLFPGIILAVLLDILVVLALMEFLIRGRSS
jgi:hypothetical protein